MKRLLLTISCLVLAYVFYGLAHDSDSVVLTTLLVAVGLLFEFAFYEGVSESLPTQTESKLPKPEYNLPEPVNK
jgi:hypothetical protein